MLAGNGRGWEKEFETELVGEGSWLDRGWRWGWEAKPEGFWQSQGMRSRSRIGVRAWGVWDAAEGASYKDTVVRGLPQDENRLGEEIWRICTLEEMWLTSEGGKGRVYTAREVKGEVEQEVSGATGGAEDCGLVLHALVCWQFFFPSRTKVACPRLEGTWLLSSLPQPPSAVLYFTHSHLPASKVCAIWNPHYNPWLDHPRSHFRPHRCHKYRSTIANIQPKHCRL